MQYKVLNQSSFSNGNYSLVPIRFEDKLKIMQWRNEQIYHLRQAKLLTIQDQNDYFENVVSKLFNQEQPNQILFSFLENGECIGYGGLVHINWTDKNAEISFIMKTRLEVDRFDEIWTQYLLLIENVAFIDLKFHRIFTYAFDLRPRIYSVLELSGFVRESVLKDKVVFEGKNIDVVIHSKENKKYNMMISNDVSNIEDFHNKIEAFISSIKFGRFLTDRNLEFNQSVKYEVSRFLDYSKTGKLLVVFNDSEILGILGYKDSSWDTEHFGFKIVSIDYFLVKENAQHHNQTAKLLLDELDTENRANSVKLVMAKVDSSYFAPVKSLQLHNFIFFECITARSFYVNNSLAVETETASYRFANLDDTEDIISIAKDNTFNKSHFYLDDNFVKKDIDSLYSKWIETAIKPDSGKKIIVIEEGGEIAGVFIYSIHRYEEFVKDTFGRWEFAAVSKKFRKAGIGRELFQAAFKACIDDGASVIDSTLVDKNIISQHLHEVLNFRISNTYYTFHKWY